MAGFGNGMLNRAVKKKVFDEISSYIIQCCKQMNEDLIMKGKKIANDENEIRNYLLEYYLDDNIVRRNHKMSMFHFQAEIPENFDGSKLKYEGRVDIKIVNQNEWFENRDAAYIVECKKLDGKSRLNNEYVKSGIKRFVVSPPHYHSYYGQNFMLGFLTVKFDINENIKKIQKLQGKDKAIVDITDLKKDAELEVYDCNYSMNGLTITLRHMFSDVSDNIIKS